jgi:hypothetical protein
MAPTVFMDPEHQPTPAEIASALGAVAPLWESLAGYVEKTYDVEPVYGRPSKRYGWDVKYRKGGRTLLSLTPDEGRFTALVVLGEKEATAARALDLGEHVQRIFDEAEPLHDGRWLFVPVESGRDVQDIESLLAAKRRPRRGVTTPAA